MRFILLITLLFALAAGAAAQPLLGDIIVNDKKPLGHVLYLDVSAGQLLTIAAGPISKTRAIGGLSMAKNNTDMLVVEEGGPFTLWSITPGGVVTTIAPVSASGLGAPTSIDLMQDGRYVVTSPVYNQRDYLHIFDPTTKKLSSLHVHTPSTQYFYQVRENPENGKLLVTSAIGNALFEFDPATSMLRTVNSSLGRNHGVDVDPFTGNYFVGTYTKINVISPAGTLVTAYNKATYSRRLRIDHASGKVWFVAGATNGAVNRIVEMSNKGVILKAHGPYPGYNFTGLDIYGSRNVTGSGPATPGSTYNVDFSWPGLPKLTYVAALSFARRPGIDIQGSRLHLALDGLFLASMQGLFVKNFQGTLDSSGRAAGSIQLPSFAPRGMTIFCSAIVTNGTTILVGNSMGVTIR